MFTWLGNSSTYEQQQWAAKVAEFLKVWEHLWTAWTQSIKISITLFKSYKSIENFQNFVKLCFFSRSISVANLWCFQSYSLVLQWSIARRGQRVLLSGLHLVGNRVIQTEMLLRILLLESLTCMHSHSRMVSCCKFHTFIQFCIHTKFLFSFIHLKYLHYTSFWPNHHLVAWVCLCYNLRHWPGRLEVSPLALALLRSIPSYCTVPGMWFYELLQVTEIFNFSQDDLLTEDMMILDTHGEVFIWIGQCVESKEKQKAFEIGQVSTEVVTLFSIGQFQFAAVVPLFNM